ncbi:MAG TPA: hypothetical protein DCS43_02255 [Verrucomicrobia bacterium]|nr:hypothetical protein [Verrucomicrobiota bacterium]
MTACKHSPDAFENVYIHVPFCSGTCIYCNFYSARFHADNADRYLDALALEIKSATSAWPARPAPVTLYMGGGTPSLLTAAQWERLATILNNTLDFSQLTEWTVEANPGTLSNVPRWLQLGVTRISLGVQSMKDATLKRIGRRHTAEDTRATVKRLRKEGVKHIGLDLIAGLPGVTDAEWDQTLEETLALAPDHISVYACSIEAGSELASMVESGAVLPVNDDSMDAALLAADERLAAHGFEHYEISNFARPGARCRHNVNIWKGADYIGFGPAAASRSGRQRWINHADLDAYCKGSPEPPCDRETLSEETDVTERLVFNFRLSDPFSLDEFVAKRRSIAPPWVSAWQGKLATLARDGLLRLEPSGWCCTERGRRLADMIAETLLP